MVVVPLRARHLVPNFAMLTAREADGIEGNSAHRRPAAWRFGSPVLQRPAVAYLIGAWLTAGAAMLVWQLSFIPLAALTFHAGEFTLLFVGWCDGQSGARLLKEKR